jgi:acetolactate synthase-1/2/3 large subunit
VTGAEALLRALGAMGVDSIFASPGSDWAPLWEALALQKPEFPRYISSRHEETAVAMALGYAKATGKLPAVVLHTTVGSLHAAMLLRAALHERMPMVVLAGESIAFSEPPAQPVGRQWLRLLTDTGGPARLMEPCVKWSYGLNSAVILPQTVQRACQLAMAAPKGPVFVSVPIELLVQTMAGDPPPAALPMAPTANPAGIDELARALGAARNPVILTEEAGKDPRAVTQLVALAEALGAPVFDAWQPYYVNFPRDHPLYGGVVAEDMAAVLKDADAVLLVDAVAPWHPPSSIADKKTYVLGEDPLHSQLPYWGYRADLILPGDTASSLAALVKQLKPASRPFRKVVRQDLSVEAGAVITTRWVARELNEILPRDAILVDETITHRLELVRLVDKLGAGGFYEASYGGLGAGLGLALGVKYAQPARPVVIAIGDGAFHYNPVVASFGASQEHRLPILVLLFSNAGYLSQRNDVLNYYPKGAAAQTQKFAGTTITPAPDYSAIARAYGGYGEKVEQPRDVRAALQRGFDAVAKGQLALIDLVLEPVSRAA